MNHKSSRALALLIIVTIFIAGSALTYSRIYGAEEVLGAKTASLSETVHGWWLSLVKFFKIKQTFRKIGWIKTTTSGFFTALETQDLTYDYNDDQKVTSEDYKLMINEINQRLQAKKPETMVSEPASGDGEGGIAAEESGGANEHLSLPSVSGFNSDAFSGSASVSYPIGLPSSAGGVAPSLAVAYSSSTVDDMWVGTETRWRNDAEHPYQKHAGELGLGWSLAGGGTITRDINETEDDPNDDKFYLSFGGGSAKLIPADGEENPGDFDDLGDNCDGIGTSIKEYKTIPDLFIKVERWGTKQGGHIRYHWLVIDGSGTKHLFGTTPMEYPDWTRNDQGQEQGFEVVPLGLCQADFYRLDPSRSWMWQNGHTRQLETKWNLVKSTNIYGIEVNYSWDWSLGDSYAWTSEGATCAGDSRCDAAYCSEDNSAKCSTKKCKDGSNKNCRQACCSNYQYPSSEFLTKVSWGKRTDPPIAAMHEVEIVREDRLDTQTHVGSLSDMNGQPLQRYIYPQRVKKILVKTRDPNTNSFQTVGGYRFEYDYAWNPDKHNDDGDGIPEDGEIVSGQVIHSMLKNITSYAGDPDGSPTPEKLPAYSFTYGQLNAFTSPDNDTQTTTENDYYLVAADNGFNGKVEFRYYDADSDGTGDALKIQLCNREKGDNCKFDRTYNYQRHRIAAKITHDGMGNWTKEQYDYQDENGNASTYGKAAVKKYVQYPSSECNHGSSVCTSGDCAWVSENASWCWKPGTCNQYPCNWNEDYRRYYTADNCPKSAVECRCECGITEQKPATDFEFLGYPQVTTIVYEKNSESVKAAQTRTNFYQAMETDSCFKPNPLKGTPLRTETYNVSIDPPSVHSYSVSVTNIRFGREGAYTYKKDTELNAYCPDYDYDKTVYVIQPQESRSAVGSGANMVCTKTGVYDYDGWNNPGKSVAYGAANCPGTVPNKDWWDKDNSDNKYTFTKYMTGDYNNTSYYFTPRPYETWTSNSNDPACNPGGCTKYGHTQTFFEDNTLGKISGYGRTTKTQTLKGEDGSVATWSTVAYEDAENRPWNAKSSTDALNHTTTTTYDSIYHMFPKTVTNAKGQTSTTVYDFEQPSNNERYGLRGLPISVTDPNNATTNSCYDNFGRATKVFLPGNNFTTCSSIDFNQNTAYYYYNDEDVGGLNNCTLANHCHSDLGKQIGGVWIPKMMVGQTTKYGFTAEAVGKLTLSHTFYNGLGQTVQTHSGFVDGDYGNINYYGIPVSDCSTNPCTTTYKDFWSSQTYNSLGQPDQVSQPWTAGPYMYSSANPVSSYDRTGFNNVAKTTYQYDGLGRATEVIYPDGKSEKTGYEVDGNPLVTDAKDRNCAVDGGYACTIKRTFANIWGQTTKVEEIEHNSADPNFPDKITTKYEYHPVLGSLTKTIDTHGTTVNIVQYNSLGQKMAMWDKDMSPAMEGDVNAWMYEYDVLGNLIFQKDPKNTAVNPSQKIKLEYDNLNRLTKKQLVRSSDNQVIRTMLEYVYDNENKSCGDGIANAVGRKCKYVSYNDNNQEIETVLYSYDNRGQLTKQIQNFKNLPHSDITNQDFVTEYTKYDEGGRNLTMKYPGFVLGSSTVQSETISTKYNRPYLEKISGTYDGGVTNQIYASAAIYNEYGQMLQFKSGNEVFNDYTYDSDTQRLNSLKVDHDGWGTQQMNLSYQYDDAGNITAIADNSGKAQGDDFYLGQNFTYDPLYRLTSASNAYAASYAYDSIGNITSKKEGDTNPTMTYTHGGDGFYHRPSKTTVNGVNTNYTYDSVGNMITSGQYTYQYDAENRLMKVIEPVSPTPTPTVLPTATPTMMVTPTATKTPTPTPNIPTPTATKTPTPVPSVLTPTPPIPTATKTPTPKPTSTVRPSPTASPYNGYKCDPKTKKCSRVKNCTLDGYTCVSSCILCGTTASPTPTSGPLGMAQSETVILGEKTIALNPGMNNIDWTAEYPKLSVSEVARSLGTKVNLITREEGGYRYIYIPGFGGQDFDLKAGNTYYIYSLETESFDWQLPEGSRQAEIKKQEPQNTGETKFIYDGEGQRISKTDSAGNTTYYISPLLEIGINADGTKFYRINYFFGGKFVAVRNGP